MKQLFNKVYSSSLFQSSSVYTLSNIINTAIPLLLLPLLTRRLTPADYGIVAMFQLSVSVIYPFIGMNLEGSITLKYYEKGNSDFASYIGTCLALVCISFLLISGLLYIYYDYIHTITQIPEIWLKYILIIAVCQFLTAIILVTYQVKVQPIKYGIFQISQSALNVFLTIYFVIVLNKTWDGRIEAQILTVLFFAIISIIILLLKKNIRFAITKIDILHALKFGLPLIPHAIGLMLFTAIDRFFLSNLLGLEQTGNYSVAFQLAAAIGLLTISFNNAFVPWLFENLNRNDIAIKTKIVKFTYLYFVALIIAAIILLLLFPIIVSIFVGRSFNSTNIYSTFIVVGFVFQGMYLMVTNYIMYAKKTHIQAAVTISIGLIKLPITYFAIIWFGAVGAAISFCITYFLFFFSTWILSSRVYEMPWMQVIKEAIAKTGNNHI